MPTASTDTIAKALGRIPSGCAILTARTDERRTGMLVSWMQQAAFEPPMISVAVKKGRPIEDLMDVAGAFVVNILGENTAPMFKHFGKGFTPEEDAFAGLKTTEVPGGIVIDDQVAWLAAEIRVKQDAGDHWIYMGEVVAAEAKDGQPYVHLRKNGLSY